MFKLKINTKKVANGHDLPKTPEPGLMFYEMVITQHDFAHPVIRVAFKDGPDIDVELYRHDVEVPETTITDNSMAGTVARYESLPLEIHFYKVMEDLDEEDGPKLDGLVYKRHIYEGTSAVQDVASFRIDKEGDVQRMRTPKYITKFTFVAKEELNELKAIDEVPITRKSGERRMWLTQRQFYSTTNVTMSNPVHKENLTRAVRLFLQKNQHVKYDTLLSALIDFGNALVIGRIKYEHDTPFAETGISGDAGDALIELTSKGDCEDFGHFYMRMFRMLSSIYKFVIPDTCDLYQKCRQLEEQYIPYNMICRVLVRGRKDFHSTLLVVPRTKANPVISYEVTDPEKSYTLPNKSYNKWHIDHYFLLDHLGIHRLNREKGEYESGPIDQLTVGKMLIYNY